MLCKRFSLYFVLTHADPMQAQARPVSEPAGMQNMVLSWLFMFDAHVTVFVNSTTVDLEILANLPIPKLSLHFILANPWVLASF